MSSMLSATVQVLAVAVTLSSVIGAIFDERTPRTLDGTLRCYQCSSDDPDPELQFVCNVSMWKEVSIPRKWAMIMQCTRRKSAFCRLKVNVLSGGSERGCMGPKYATNQTAHFGCFDSDDGTRTCLCDTNLCNRAGKVGSSGLSLTAITLSLTAVTLETLHMFKNIEVEDWRR